MSSARFASITADILARKGEARPWSQEMPGMPPPVLRAEPAALVSAPPPVPPARDKSCSVRMSGHDFERLGILAVKSAVTRQQLLKEALALFLETRARQLSCACLNACAGSCDKNSG